jgi:hypothetical protein
MAQPNVDDFLNTVSANNKPTSKGKKKKPKYTPQPNDFKNAETQTAFNEASGAASELLGAVRRYNTGAISKAELEKVYNTYQSKINLLKTKDSTIAANIEASAFGSVVTQGLGTPTIKSDASGKVTKNDKAPVTQRSVEMTNAEQLDEYLSRAGTSIGPSGPTVQVTYPNKLDPRGLPTVEESYLYVEPGTKGTAAYEGSQLVQKPSTEKGVQFGTTDVIRDKYIKQLVKQYGSKQAVVDRLKEVGLLTTNKNVPSGAIDQALDQIIAEYTYEQVSAYKNYGVKEFPTLDEYMSNRPKRGGDSTTTTRTTIFSDTDFRALAQQVGQALVERDLSPAELKKLQPILEKAQRKTPAVTTTTDGADGSTKSIFERTGLNSQQFLIEELAKTDEAKATQMIGFYDVYKQMTGVQ